MNGVQRWGGYVALVIVFAIACGLLSWWQWARRAETVAEIQRVETNYDATPADVDQVLPALDSWRIADEWMPVELHGHYLTDQQLLVRNRPYNGASGYEVLVPLQLADGRVFVVDRGWIPVGASIEAPDAVPAAPSGDVTVIARLKPGEPELPGRTAPPGQLATIHLPSVAAVTGSHTYTGAYGLLASEDPVAPDPRPAPAPKPAADEGPHLSYAIQWIAFGILAFIGLFWAIRRERRIAALPSGEQAAARAPRQRSSVDSDYEDAVVDADSR
jgi:cytochrome oxidase assembly protein ShyY1